MGELDRQDEALFALLSFLEEADYRFVTTTPETHRRFVERSDMTFACDLRGALGWSLPFRADLLPAALLTKLANEGWIETADGILRSKIRVSSIGDRLFIHSAYPTDRDDAVFLGPDSYRFADLIRTELARLPGTKRLVDIGAGAGVGAILAAPLVPGARLTLTDINPLALRFARVNARHAGLTVETIEGSGIDAVTGALDLAIANPPFIIDEAHRAYRDGGAMRGAQRSLDWVLAAARRVEPGGSILLYTGSAIVEGRDGLRERLEGELASLGAELRYRELDPDIFGEELERPGYEEVERIAAIGAVISL